MDRSDLLIQYLSLLIKANDKPINPHIEKYTAKRIDKVCAEIDKVLGIDGGN
jgi:hypothetical protein